MCSGVLVCSGISTNRYILPYALADILGMAIIVKATAFGRRNDTGYPHDGRADKNSYPHDGRADKDSYPHDSRADKDSYPHDRHNLSL